jgi:transaldolase
MDHSTTRARTGRLMKTLSDLRIAIFADGADKVGMLEMYAKPYIKGFTTNPTLMHKAGVNDYVSVFAGRIADTGVDPVPLMAEAVRRLAAAANAELIWASPRELLNIFQADGIGCHVITVTNDILKKLSLVGKDLGDYSLETVKMFYNDGRAAEFVL